MHHYPLRGAYVLTLDPGEHTFQACVRLTSSGGQGDPIVMLSCSGRTVCVPNGPTLEGK